MVVCHVTAGLQFCPNPPAFPAPEYWIEFTSPMAFCAFWMTVFASCADAIPAPSASNNTSIIHILLAIIPPAVVSRELLYLGLGVRAHYTTVGRLAHALRIGYTGPFKVRHLRTKRGDGPNVFECLVPKRGLETIMLVYWHFVYILGVCHNVVDDVLAG